MNDTLSSANPVFLKVEYGPASTGLYLTSATLWVTLGFSTDGAGTITGNKSVRTAITSQYNSTAGRTGTSYVSGDGSRLSLYLSTAPGGPTEGGNYDMFLTIERSKNLMGIDTPEGVSVIAGSATQQNSVGDAWTNQFVPKTGIVPPRYEGSNCLVPVALGTAVNGTDVNVWPHFVFGFAGEAKPQLLNLLCYKRTDVSRLSVIPVDRFGTQITFLAIGQGPASSSAYFSNDLRMPASGGPTPQTTTGLLMRFD